MKLHRRLKQFGAIERQALFLLFLVCLSISVTKTCREMASDERQLGPKKESS